MILRAEVVDRARQLVAAICADYRHPVHDRRHPDHAVAVRVVAALELTPEN